MMKGEVAYDDFAMDMYTEMPMDDMGMSMEMEHNKGMSSQTVLYIVIGVCVVAGVVLGIIMGKRAANK